MRDLNGNQFKGKKNKRRLSTKFLTVFFIPFLFGTIISTVVVIIYINIAQQKLVGNSKVQLAFENSKEKASIPIIINAKFHIIDNIEKYLNNLVKIRQIYLSLKVKLNMFNMKTIILSTFFNSINKNEIKNFNESYILNNEDPEFLLSHAKWFVNKTINNTQELDDNNLISKQLYYFSYLIPLLKTIINISHKESLIYIMSTSNDLIIKYPIKKKYINGSDFNYQINRRDCLNSSENYPNYFYYKCRPFYISMKNAEKINYSFSISDIYKFASGNYGISICIQFNDFLTDGKIIICQDLNFNVLNEILNSLNSKLEGYFFVTKINSKIPIYYPYIFDIEEYKEISKMEFTLNNKYYSNEISEFRKNEKYLNQIFENNSNITFNTYKNGDLYKYTITPIFFNFGDNNTFSQKHFLSIIFVRPKIINIEQYQDSKITNVFISLLFSIMACIQLLLTKYLISSLVKMLIKPIKLIKKLLQTDFEVNTDNNINNNIMNNYNNNNNNNILQRNNTSISKDNIISENSPLLNHSNLSGKTNENEISFITNYSLFNNNYLSLVNNENENNENNTSSSSSSNQSDDDEDNNNNKTNNIQKLFIKFVDLKNSFKSFDDQTNENIPYLVHAQNIFSNINNIGASSTCQSNISSFFIKKKEFDKAISHLNEGIKNIRNKILISSNQDDLKRQFKTENLTNRYLKLFYCYKSYFKYLKKIKKKNPNELINNNFYIDHHIEKYKKNVNEYLELINKINDEKDLCLALLEKVEEIIQFEIIPSKNYHNQNLSQDELLKKQLQIKNILELFKQIDKINDNKFSQNYNVIQLINILKFDTEIVKAMDIPPSVLIQRTNYLKGKFYLKCCHYKKAISFFENALIYNKVGNIRIIISSIKKLIKISETYLNLVKNDIEIHKNESKYKYELRDDNLRKQILINYIYNLKKEIKVYEYHKKDICFILNLSNISSVHSDRFHNLHKVLMNIYENILTYKDRISIIAYIDGIFKFILDLNKKTIENDNFLYEQLQNITSIINIDFSKKSSSLFQSLPKADESILSKSIQFAYQYLRKKQMGNLTQKRENWYIYLTNDISLSEIKQLKKKSLKKYFNNRDEDNSNNVIVLFYENVKIKNEIVNWLKYNKSCVIVRNEIDKLKNIMGTSGEMQQINFDFEKYKD